jgi:hypothetical protein
MYEYGYLLFTCWVISICIVTYNVAKPHVITLQGNITPAIANVQEVESVESEGQRTSGSKDE